MNSKKAVAAPATVSGEPKVQHGHWETGKAGPKRRRPASQETCQHGHPTGGRGVHTERSFAAVTAMPVRASLPRHSAHRPAPRLRISALFAPGFVFTRCFRVCERKRGTCVMGKGHIAKLAGAA